jgi:LPXTG-motif cell wall-anchored protein
LEDGKNESFKIPKGQKFNIDGQMVDAFGLRKGMKISATKVVESTEIEVANQRRITGTMPPPPPAPPAEAPILIAKAEPVAPPPAPEAPAPPAQLPKTGSSFPLIGILGLVSLLAAFGLRATRPRI